MLSAMNLWVLTFVASTALAAAGFVVVAVLWLKKLRETLAIALGETASQQVRTAQRLGEAIAQLQHRQHLNEQRIQALADANIRLRQEVTALTAKLEPADSEQPPATPTRLIH